MSERTIKDAVSDFAAAVNAAEQKAKDEQAARIRKEEAEKQYLELSNTIFGEAVDAIESSLRKIADEFKFANVAAVVQNAPTHRNYQVLGHSKSGTIYAQHLMSLLLPKPRPLDDGRTVVPARDDQMAIRCLRLDKPSRLVLIATSFDAERDTQVKQLFALDAAELPRNVQAFESQIRNAIDDLRAIIK